MFEIDKKSSKANVPVTVRFTEELYRDLKSIAEKERVSFNNLVLQCCEYAISEYISER